MTQLQVHASKGNFRAVSAFWDEVENLGTPLIEPYRDGNFWLTFLWRRRGDEKTVAVASYLNNLNLQEARLQWILGTDVWFRSYIVPSDLHLQYRFAVNDLALRSTLDIERDRARYLEHDPLNPRSFTFYPSGKKASFVELPGVSRRRLDVVRPGIPRGRVEQRAVSSEHLRDNKRRVWVYTPRQLDERRSGQRFPLLIFFDGGTYVNLGLPEMLDNLIADGRLPPMFAMMVDTQSKGWDARHHELGCNPLFVRFLVEELLPSMPERHLVSRDPRDLIAAGFSMGGLMSIYALSRGAVGKAIAGSPSTWWDGESLTADLLKCNEPLPSYAQLHITVGQLEGQIAGRDMASILESTRRLVRVLRNRGTQVAYFERRSVLMRSCLVFHSRTLILYVE